MADTKIHDPRGNPPEVRGTSLAARLDALEHKKIYLVLSPFDNTDVFMEQLRRVLAMRLPALTTEIIAVPQFGADSPEIRARVEADGDGAIVGVGMCSTCSPSVVLLAAGLEGAGVPTVSIHSKLFQRISHSVATTKGMPGLRRAFIEQAVAGLSADELRDYIEGDDPVTGRPFFEEIVEGLLAPLDGAEQAGAGSRQEFPPYVETDDEDAAQRLFADRNWTDGLPVILPTAARVEAMLAGTSLPPEHVVGALAPAGSRVPWEATVEKVAVNAVMAGARPEYLPVILALAASGVSARMSSVSSFATISIVNGPIRTEIGMNPGVGAMGPYNHANATIGRAYGLASQNIQGGSIPGDTYVGTLGNNYAYTAVFPENEELSPWEPLHTQHGFSADESAVSLFTGAWATITGSAPLRFGWEDAITRALRALDPAFPPMFIVDPKAAKDFVDAGYPTKESVSAMLARHATLSYEDYWGNSVVQATLRPSALAGAEPLASRLSAAPGSMVEIFDEKDINVAVVGGGMRDHSKLIVGKYATTVSVDKFR